MSTKKHAKKISGEIQNKVYKIVADNYKKGRDTVYKLIKDIVPDISIHTVGFYISVCNSLESCGSTKNYNASKKLIEAWKNRLSKLSTSQKDRQRQYGKKVQLSETERNKIYDIIITSIIQ